MQNAIAQGHLNAQIQVLIYNNPEAKAAARAANWDVPTVLLNHRLSAPRRPANCPNLAAI